MKETNDDEEVSLDLSKVKKFFKGKEKPKEHIKEEKEVESKEDEDISLDLGKVKNFFKKKK